MDPGSKVSSNGGFWPCIGISALNVNSGFRKPILIPTIKPPNQNQLSGCDPQDSVPSTPESDLEEIDYKSEAALDVDTREIIDSFLKQLTGLSHSKCCVNKQAVSTMKRVVDELTVKHRITYNGMISRVGVNKAEDLSLVTTVAKEVFKDGITNWGRIASLLAFGAVLSKHLTDSGRSECVSLVAEKISSYLLSDQRDWLVKNKAWDGFVDFFHVTDTEGAVRNVLMAIGSVATFSAALAYWIR